MGKISNLKNNTVCFRLSDSEKEKVYEEMQLKGYSRFSEFCKDTIMNSSLGMNKQNFITLKDVQNDIDMTNLRLDILSRILKEMCTILYIKLDSINNSDDESKKQAKERIESNWLKMIRRAMLFEYEARTKQDVADPYCLKDFLEKVDKIK